MNKTLREELLVMAAKDRRYKGRPQMYGTQSLRYPDVSIASSMVASGQ